MCPHERTSCSAIAASASQVLHRLLVRTQRIRRIVQHDRHNIYRRKSACNAIETNPFGATQWNPGCGVNVTARSSQDSSPPVGCPSGRPSTLGSTFVLHCNVITLHFKRPRGDFWERRGTLHGLRYKYSRGAELSARATAGVTQWGLAQFACRHRIQARRPVAAEISVQSTPGTPAPALSLFMDERVAATRSICALAVGLVARKRWKSAALNTRS
jgi:hypothetical protein